MISGNSSWDVLNDGSFGDDLLTYLLRKRDFFPTALIECILYGFVFAAFDVNPILL